MNSGILEELNANRHKWDYHEWKRWFAWYPVRDNYDTWRWFERIWRRKHVDYYDPSVSWYVYEPRYRR